MYIEFVVAFIFFVLFILLMAVGVIVGKKELKGSCGGLGRIMGEDCMFCEKKDECTHEQEHGPCDDTQAPLEGGKNGNISLRISLSEGLN